MQPETLPPQSPPKFATPKGDERSRLIRTRTALVLGHPFFGLLALRLKLVEAPWIITAGVDGKHLYYNPSYIAPLSDAELKALWAHEVMHCTNGHPWRRGERDRQRWNWACDYAIDPILREGGLIVPNETINPKWRGWSAEQIYPLIPVNPQNKCGGMQGQSKPGSGQQGDGQGKGGQGQQGQGQGGQDPRAPNYMPGKDVLLDASEDEANQQQAEWKQAIASAAQVAKSQGKLPGGFEIYIENWLEPRVLWKALLRKFIQLRSKQDYSWAVRNRRYGSSGVYLPGLRSEQMPPVVIAIDTSGSIGGEELKQFAGEMGAIIEEAKPEVAYQVFCDARVAHTAEFYPGDPLTFNAKGGGGTSFVPVFDWVKEQEIEPACLIYLTDMYGSYPKEEPPYPVLWASTTKNIPSSYEPPFGEVVYLDFE
jgi:predicted metal-dependent peptidase